MKFYKVIVLTVAVVVPAAAQAEQGNTWRMGIGGGTTIYSEMDDPYFASLSLAREFKQGYVEIGVSTVHGGVTQSLLSAVPVDSEAITLSTGRSFDDLSLDSYVSFGRRRFDPEMFQRLGQMVTVDSNGASFAIGGALTYDVSLSASIILSPFVAIDYDKVDIARAVTLPGGAVRTITSNEEGVTGSVGASVQKLFGAHAIGANAAFVATSNSSAARSGTAGGTGNRIVAALNVPGQSDEWLALGASASFAVAEKWRLNFNVNRSIGFAGPEATTISLGLSTRF